MVPGLHRLGRAYRLIRGYGALTRYALGNLDRLKVLPVYEVFHRQIYFTGVEALPIVAVLGLICGSLIVTQVTALVGGNSELTVKILIWTLVQEAGPLLSATIIIARSSAAIASELALMKNHHELESLVHMRIEPLDYLIVPRVAGVTLAVSALSVYFLIVAIGGGLAVSAIFQNVSFGEQLARFLDIVGLGDLVLVALKGCVFGIVIATISCYHGLHAAASMTGVPRAAIRAVMQCLLGIFAFDALFAYFAR